MNLLQIHEPGQTPLPHQDSVAIGIDLGTTNSVVAIASGEEAEVIHDIQGRALLPSVVYYAPDGSVTVGHEAKSLAAEGHASVISSVKRLMGRGAKDIKTLAGATPYELAETSGMVRIEAGNRQVTPVEVSAEILRKLKRTAEHALGKPISKAVITVPAYFDDAARAATKDAAKLAGLDVLRLVNEPTAAALAYGLDNAAEGIYAVYDLGGGTFDISLLRLEKGVFQVLATGGDAALGGDDLDHALAELVLEKAGDSDAITSTKAAVLLAEARDAKEKLTVSTSVKLQNLFITRDEFNALINPLVERTLEACEQALADAKLAAADVKGVVLVGGSTRVPLVRQKVEAFFGKAPLTNVNPDEVVAVGAALQAEGLSGNSDNLLLDVIPLSLGIETMGGLVEKLIHRNTPIPVSTSQEFTTYQDGQTGMVIHVLQGEREMVEQCRSLARFELSNIPPLPAGIARIKVTYTVDADGLLTVSAREEITGMEQQIEVKPSYGLTVDEIEHMLVQSMEHARDDIMQRLLAEAKVEAERTIIELESVMKSDSQLLIDGEKAAFEEQIAILRKAIAGNNREAVDYEAQRLGQISRAFAERRMDSAIQAALKGVHIANVESN